MPTRPSTIASPRWRATRCCRGRASCSARESASSWTPRRCARRSMPRAPPGRRSIPVRAGLGGGPVPVQHRGDRAQVRRAGAADSGGEVRGRRRGEDRLAARRALAPLGAGATRARDLGAARPAARLPARPEQARRRPPARAGAARLAQVDRGGRLLRLPPPLPPGDLVITPGLWRRALARGAQWRLLLLYLAALALPALLAALPVLGFLGELLDHSPLAPGLLQGLDSAAE